MTRRRRNNEPARTALLLALVLVLFIGCLPPDDEQELPTTFYPSQDVFVRGGSLADYCMQTYSPATSIQLYVDYNFCLDSTYIQFDFSAIPQSTFISFAQLHLKVSYCSIPGQVELRFRNVLSPWSEYTTTYNNQPSVGGVAWWDLQDSFSENGWYTQDATNAVQFWINNSTSNHGLKVEMTDYGAGPDWAYVGFWSKDAPPADRPYITVQY